MLARVVAELIAAGVPALAGYMAWGVRGRSSEVFGRSVWRGPSARRALALTFDDGPSESTPKLLDLLAEYGARATFCVLGFHTRRLPRVVRRLVAEGHEIANHSDTHPTLYLRSGEFIAAQVGRAQETIAQTAGIAPRFFRAPYGARWFGLAAAQEKHGLTGLMWTAIASDWRLSAPEIAARMQARTRPGAVFCFHDGRELAQDPDISSTLGALACLLPAWRKAGYELIPAGEMFPAISPAVVSTP